MKRIFLCSMLFFIAVAASHAQQIQLEGTCKMIRAGSCEMTSEPYGVKIILTVDTTTFLFSGEEFTLNDEGAYEKSRNITWTGEVLNPMAIRFRQDRQFSCAEGKRIENLHFIGVINCEKDCTVKLNDRFAMCPDANCIFDIEYDLKLVQ